MHTRTMAQEEHTASWAGQRCTPYNAASQPGCDCSAKSTVLENISASGSMAMNRCLLMFDHCSL